MAQGYGQYTKVYQKAAVSTLDQKKMIVLLYDGAIKFLSIAMNKMNGGDAYEAHTNLIRGKSIVAELLASLDMDAGGDIAINLQRLYAYMFNTLIDANMERDVNRVQEVIELLKQLREAWKVVESPKQASAGPDNANSEQPAEQGRTSKINVRG
jgi:flagellar protein FliS